MPTVDDNGLLLILTKILEAAEESGTTLFFPKIVDEPKGNLQNSDVDIFDHMYIDQVAVGLGGDSFSGSCFYPLSNGKYLEVGFAI